MAAFISQKCVIAQQSRYLFFFDGRIASYMLGSSLKRGAFCFNQRLYSFFLIACVASVSVRFRSKDPERPRNGIFGFIRARNGTRAKNERGRRGRGRKETFLTFLPHPSPLRYSRHFSRALSLSFPVLCSETAWKRSLGRLSF